MTRIPSNTILSAVGWLWLGCWFSVSLDVAAAAAASFVVTPRCQHNLHPRHNTVTADKQQRRFRTIGIIAKAKPAAAIRFTAADTAASLKSPNTNTEINPMERKPVHQQQQHEVHLVSLALPSSSYCPVSVRDTWKWKDAVLGDGRDFFVPRPKTLQALQHYLCNVLNKNSNMQLVVNEVVVLSNCARFEIIVDVVVTPSNDNDESGDNESDDSMIVNDDSMSATESDDMVVQSSRQRRQEVLLKGLARGIAAQVQVYQNRPFSNLPNLLPLDWPESIDMDADACWTTDNSSSSTEKRMTAVTEELSSSRYWQHQLVGTRAVAEHLCIIAAGMAPRPNRPDRPVPFRPFSSRDAHIMLQLKRTLADGCQQDAIGRLLRCALQAGKAVRNPAVVPELELLRPYGTGNSKYDSQPPQALLEQVTLVSCISAGYVSGGMTKYAQSS